MILDYVPDGADLIVKRASPLDTKVLRHCDLHTFDMRAVPERFEHGVGKTEEQHVVHGSFAEVMINAENRLLVERFEQDGVEFASGNEVPAKRLFNDDTGIVSASRLRQVLHHGAKQGGRNGRSEEHT